MESPFKAGILAGKVALVTGGTSGIGLEIATQLGLHGAKVAVTGRRQAVLDAASTVLQKQGITVLGLQGDVRQQESCERWVSQPYGLELQATQRLLHQRGQLEAKQLCAAGRQLADQFLTRHWVAAQWGGLDILVNCAAGNFLATAEDLSQNGFKTVMEIDVLGTFTMCRAAYPHLSHASTPCVINISATLHYGATWWQAHASAAKAAIDSLTRSLALEWGHAGVRVNGVAPGPIEGTAGLSKLAPGAEDEAKKLIVASVPLGRMGHKWDIAMACVFLASPAASYVSGDTLVVDGASWMWRPELVPRAAVSQVSRGVESKSRAMTGTGAAPRSKM